MCYLCGVMVFFTKYGYWLIPALIPAVGEMNCKILARFTRDQGEGLEGACVANQEERSVWPAGFDRKVYRVYTPTGGKRFKLT